MATIAHTSDATVERDIQVETSLLKLNADENTENTRRFGVTGIPTLLLFEEGKPVERIVGFRPKSQLLTTLQPHFCPTPAPAV